MKKLISRCFGAVAGVKFPRPVQKFINQKYIDAFEIDMSEFLSASDYDSLNALFTRRLVRGREICAEPSAFLSPSDGVIFECGATSDFSAFSIKGHKYDIWELLGLKSWAGDLQKQNSEIFISLLNLDDIKTSRDFKMSADLIYTNIYLSPKDYHHYHAPCDLRVIGALYIPGELHSVAKKYLLKVPNLYAKNERVVLLCKMSNGGLLWLVFVGALNVGKMKFDFDERIQTNAKANDKAREILNFDYNKFDYGEGVSFKKGEHIGNFELGSTIVMIAEKEFLEFEISQGQRVKFAQKIASLK
ncbi:archaetidylserine decarboxylase [Campylobacter sp. JMF_02 ED1]|uniref:archaetidylserine decarboxylase n=1 Tax=Campylobacter sp. JMF_02 ED1 TaxID=2983826 RepID=UPI0022E9CD3B|nr:archaetidylserine decarboxylase [Campylobacter sp. JMF_02 ED1]MDA3050407.1 archaetidylserine decarboxylase [Campylobacter sp. JMF_02 ED1]